VCVTIKSLEDSRPCLCFADDSAKTRTKPSEWSDGRTTAFQERDTRSCLRHCKALFYMPHIGTAVIPRALVACKDVILSQQTPWTYCQALYPFVKQKHKHNRDPLCLKSLHHRSTAWRHMRHGWTCIASTVIWTTYSHAFITERTCVRTGEAQLPRKPRLCSPRSTTQILCLKTFSFHNGGRDHATVRVTVEHSPVAWPWLHVPLG